MQTSAQRPCHQRSVASGHGRRLLRLRKALAAAQVVQTAAARPGPGWRQGCTASWTAPPSSRPPDPPTARAGASPKRPDLGRCAVMAPSPMAPALPVLQVHLLNGHTAKSARTSRRNFRVVVPPRTFRSYVGPLGRFGALVFEHRLSAGTRVTSHHGILHDFHHQATTSCTTHELSLF